MSSQGKIPIKRIVWGLAAFALTAGLLFGGNALAQRIKFGSVDRTYWSSQGIEKFETRQEGQDLILEVEAKEIKNQRLTMERLIHLLEKGKGRTINRIIYLSPEALALEPALNKLSFALTEARAMGRYTLLPAVAEALEKEDGVRTTVEIGEEFIFIAMEKDGDRLYRAVRLPALSQTTVSKPGGER